MSVSLELRLEIQDLMTHYCHVLDDGDLADWPGLFTEDCFYQVIPRENFDADLPLATMRCESRGMLRDRVMAIKDTYMFEPRYMRHLTSGLRIVGETDGVISTECAYAVFETLQDEYTRVFNVGRYIDEIVRDDGALRFRRRSCVFDSELVPNSLVYPI